MFNELEIANRFAEELATVGNNFFSMIHSNDLRRFSLSSSTGCYWEVNGPVFDDYAVATMMAEKYGTYPVLCQSSYPYVSSETDNYTLFLNPIYANVNTWYDIQKCDSKMMAVISNNLARYGLKISIQEYYYDGYYASTKDLHRINRVTISHF